MDADTEAKPDSLFTITTDNGALSIGLDNISAKGIDWCEILDQAIKILPDILDREERRKHAEENTIEVARGTLMQALTFGSDEDREHAEDAVQDLVGFIGRQDEAGCDCNTSDACDCGSRDSCSNCPPDIDTGTAHTITEKDADCAVAAAASPLGMAGYHLGEPALFDRDGNPIPAEIAKIAFRHLATAREDARRKNNDDAMKRAEQIAAVQGGCLLQVSNTHGGGTVLSVFEGVR